MRAYIFVVLITTMVFTAFCGSDTPEKKDEGVANANKKLARTILADESFNTVLDRSREIIKSGFNAGDGYGQVWIRDLATFIEISCEVYDKQEIRDNLLTFFKFQGEDGNIIDGYAPKDKAHAGDPNLITSDLAPGLYAHKNTVETDQESSLIQAIHIYVTETGDKEFLGISIDCIAVIDRMEKALQFLLDKRMSEKFGLIWGATTADWGDVQPENGWGVDMNENTQRAVDIYDNAMFLVAIENFLEYIEDSSEREARWRAVRKSIKENVRKHLWDESDKKFLPHVYLNESPFSADFDEDSICYHGGTAVAILAGLLTHDEIQASLDRMVHNVRESGAGSIGLTVYPPYPESEFPNMPPYHYQNGGDWTWFGGRMIHALIEYGFIEEAYRELKPMTDRVIANDGFFEWYSVKNKPRGSGTFRGSAGVLGKAIMMLTDWAEKNSG